MNFRKPDEDLFDSSRMSFGEHLEELRKVLVKALAGVAVGCVFGFLFANQVIQILTQPLVEAIATYQLNDASRQLVDRDGYVAPEFIPWLEQDQYIPRQVRVDPGELVKAIQSVVPDFAAKVNVDPYGFQNEDFDLAKLPALCQTMVPAENVESSTAEQVQLVWSLLQPAEQTQVQTMAGQSSPSPQDQTAIATIFNRLSRLSELHSASEYSQFVDEPERGWLDWISPPAEKPLVKIKQRVDDASDPDLERRLNRALLSSTFSGHLPELKMELVALEIWEESNFQPQSLGVSEPFMAWIKAGLVTGLILSGPWVFYQLWSFVATGLYPHEQKYVHIFLPVSIGLFVSGVLLAFLFVFQPVLGFLFSFNQQMGIAPQMRINDWLSFVMFLPLGFGLAFQLPLVMLFMNRIGLFQVRDYLSKWRIAIMIIFVLAMILTPADPVSMLLLACPLTLLYFLGIGMCHWMPSHQNPFGEVERDYTT